MMNSNVIETLMPIMFVSKVLGMCRFSCRVNVDSTSLYSSNSTWCTFMDIVQMAFYLACTYVSLQLPAFYIRNICVSRHWLILMSLRFSEHSIIKLTNGIAAFDRKLCALPGTPSPPRVGTPGRRFWSAVIAVYFAFYVLMVGYMHVSVVRKHDMAHLVENALFSVPRVADFVVTAALCFYLGHLGRRFQTLDAVWERLVAGLLADPGGWTAAEVAVLAECVRLLHAQLSGLLGLFNRTYGRVLVVFLVCVVMDMSFHCFIVLFGHKMKLDMLPAIALDAQNATFVVLVLAFASWTNERKKNIIVWLRCNHNAKLTKDIRIQMQFFMDQISTYDLNETLACGLLNYELKTLIPIIVLLIKISATMIQMDDQPYLRYLISDLMSRGPWNE